MNADEPILSTADIAAMLGERDHSIREWQRAGLGSHFGRKHGHFISYSVRDAAGVGVSRDLIASGFPPPLAARVAAAVVAEDPEPDAVLAGRAVDLAMIVPDAGSGVKADRANWRLPRKARATISVPVGRIFADVVDRARRLRAARAH